jgi:hypothetical protein
MGPPVEALDPGLLAETLAALSDRLSAQEDLLAALIERLGRDEAPSGRWTWRYLTEPQSAKLLADLTEWITWLVDRYQLEHTRHQIPPCWAEHPVAVEELTALMVSWKATYTGPDRPPSDNLIAWHDRWLWPCLTRINEGLQIWNGCRAGQHRDSSRKEAVAQALQHPVAARYRGQ